MRSYRHALRGKESLNGAARASSPQVALQLAPIVPYGFSFVFSLWIEPERSLLMHEVLLSVADLSLTACGQEQAPAGGPFKNYSKILL